MPKDTTSMKSLSCAHKESYHKVCPGPQCSVSLHGTNWPLDMKAT